MHSNSTVWALTIHSSRTRFAGRLNSGVRPLGETMAIPKVIFCLPLALAMLPVSASELCRIRPSSMDTHSSLAGALSSAIQTHLSRDKSVRLTDSPSRYDLDIRIVQTKLINIADRFLPPSEAQPDFFGVYVLLDRNDRFLNGSLVTCKGGTDSCAASIVRAAVHVCGARPNNSFKPNPLRGSA